jgi:hypothetical protein
VIRRLLLLDRPQETRFFMFAGGFGLVLAAIYWFLTYELAGTILLAGFGLGAGLVGFALLRAGPRAPASAARKPVVDGEPGADREPGALDVTVQEVAAGDTPFEDSSGRLPGESLAPMALGLGIALALTAIVFGPWLLIAGLLPGAWGAWAWLSGARAELDATVATREDGDPPGAPSAP